MPGTEARIRDHLLVYALSITVSSLFTSGLNIIHAEYILGMPLTPKAFIAPVIAGIIFGYLLARIKLLHEAMRLMAHTDPLTRIYNRLHFTRFLESEIDRVKRYGGTFSIIFFDLDGFKNINDEYGHLVGDEALETVAKIVKEANRSADIFARYGGEEFIVLTPATGRSGAAHHAERLRSGIEHHPFSRMYHISCSFGVTEFDAEKDDASSLLKRADAALYQAKHQGRNRVVVD